jgi:hypothetical protein
MRTSRSVLSRLFALVVGSTVAGAQPTLPVLSASQRDALDAGRPVVITDEVAGVAWPRVTVLRVIPGPPDEAAAVFADYARHASYLPNVLRSEVSRVVDSVTAEISYVLSVPIVSDESYTVRNRITVVAATDSAATKGYRIAWTLVRASSTKAADGEARFEAYRGGTLFTYRNLVVPGGRIAGLGVIKRKAQRDVEATAAAIAQRIATVRATDRAGLDRLLRALPDSPYRSPRASGSPTRPPPPAR